MGFFVTSYVDDDDDGPYVPPPPPPAPPSWECIARPFRWGLVEVTPRLLQAVRDEFMSRPDHHIVVEVGAGGLGGSAFAPALGGTETLEMRDEELWALVTWCVPERPQPPQCFAVAIQFKGPRGPSLVSIYATTLPMVQGMSPVTT